MVADDGWLKIIVGTVLAVFGWAWKLLFTRVNNMTVEIAKIKQDLPRYYTTKEDTNRAFDRLEKKFDKHIESVSDNFSKLFDKLDSKQDKIQNK